MEADLLYLLSFSRVLEPFLMTMVVLMTEYSLSILLLLLYDMSIDISLMVMDGNYIC